MAGWLAGWLTSPVEFGESAAKKNKGHFVCEYTKGGRRNPSPPPHRGRFQLTWVGRSKVERGGDGCVFNVLCNSDGWTG